MKSKSSLFVERWAGAEQNNMKLGYAVVALSVVCLVLAMVAGCSVLKPRSVYCVPGVAQTGLAVAPASGSMIANVFAVSWLLNWTNFTPATVEDAYARARRFMSPVLLSKTHISLEKDMEEVKKNNISSLFSLSQDPVVETDKNGFCVTVRGQKGVYVGKEEIKVQQVVYRLRLRPVNPTDGNPYGMMVDRIDQEEGA
ncbi:MAG: hypothetical protein HYZ86_04050 [Candidatus Omnitrophica bacterium]|nr:hypothetical protein [Candidatus Omnitrophota bacterium]